MSTLDQEISQTGPIDLIKHRFLYLFITVALLIPGIYFMVVTAMESPYHSPLKPGIDFVGGTILEYGFEKPLQQEDLNGVREILDSRGYTGSVIQLQETREDLKNHPAESSNTETSAETGAETDAETGNSEKITSIVSIRSKQLEGSDGSAIQAELAQKFGNLTLLQKNSIGPTMAQELMTNGLLALGLAYLLIVGYLTFRFQLDYAVCAIIALAHDVVIVVGAFSALGYFFHTEVDSLFITGILTVVGFSVHDTIVVFDRLRENTKVYHSKKLPFSTLANLSVNQTLARSINTSLTALLPLIALYFMGGETTREFVLCMILGIAVGTYSSIFVASVLLTMWRERNSHSSSSAVTGKA